MKLHDHISQWTKDEYETERIHGMAAAYRQKYREWISECEVSCIEEHLTIPLLKDGYSLHGYLDKIVTTPTEGLAVIDHKTTSEELHPGARYWARLEHDPQATVYLLLATLNHWDIDTIIWDVARKPAIRPKKMTKKQHTTLLDTGEYLDCPLEFPKRVSKDGFESPECFGIRVFLWCREHDVFQRHNVVRTADIVEGQLNAIHGTSRMIDACRITNNWPQNFNACCDFGRLCDYAPVCHEGCALDSEYYQDRHSGDWQALSHSSMASFHGCPRRFYFSQIERRAPIDKESDALRIGSAWHNTLDLLYKEFCYGEGHGNPGPGNVPDPVMGGVSRACETSG